MADYLDEDDVISNQKYAVLSYVLPSTNQSVKAKGKKLEGFETPMIKFRGAFSSIEECNRRIKKLQNTDTYFHMFVIEVGKWGGLLTPEEIDKNDNVQTVYKNEQMNEFMKGYREQKDKADEHYHERKRLMREKAEADGSKEGQALLAGEKENPLSIKKRLEDSKQFLEELKKQIEEVNDVHNKATEALKNYTEEEIEQAIKSAKNLKID